MEDKIDLALLNISANLIARLQETLETFDAIYGDDVPDKADERSQEDPHIIFIQNVRREIKEIKLFLQLMESRDILDSFLKPNILG